MRRPSHEACARLAAAIDAYIEKADSDLEKELAAAGYADPAQTMSFIQRLENALFGILRAGDQQVIDSFAGFVDLKTWWALSVLSGRSLSRRMDDVASEFKTQFTEFMPKLITSYSTRIDHELAVQGMTKRTASFIDSWSGQLARLMKTGSDRRIGDMVRDAIAKGESVEKLTRRIMESGIRDTEWQARRVALTETLRAHSYSQLEAYRLNPAVTGKRWRHTGAKFSKPRENHQAISGQEVDVDQPFTLPGAKGGTYYPMVPRDTNLPPGESINCHCLLQPVVDSGILGRPLEERERLYQEARAKQDWRWEQELNERKREEALQWRIEHDTTGNEKLWAAEDRGQKDARWETARRTAARAHMPDGMTEEDQEWYIDISGVEVRNGPIVDTSQHMLQRMRERGLKAGDVVDALKNPIRIRKTVYDKYGRPSRQYIGRFATVAVNPETGRIASAWQTSSERLKRIQNAQVNEHDQN